MDLILPDGSGGVKFCVFPHRISFELNPVSIVDEAIEDGVGESGIAEVIMPEIDRELAGDEGGSDSVSVLDHFEQISSFGIGQGSQAQVVQDEQMGFGESFEERAIGAVGTGQGDLIEELREPEVKGAEALAAGSLGQGTGEEGLADAGGADDEQVVVISDPGAGGEAEEERFFDAPWRSEVDLLDGGVKFKMGFEEEAFHLLVRPPRPLSIDEQGKALFEGEVLEESGLEELFLEGLGHPGELEGVELVKDGFGEHGEWVAPFFFHW